MRGEEHEARPYPIDYDVLEKGDYIEPGRVEEIVGEKRNTYLYPLKCMNLVQEI